MSESASGIPDDAIGPRQQTVDEQLALSEGADAEAMAAKLQSEADARTAVRKRFRQGKPDGHWRS